MRCPLFFQLYQSHSDVPLTVSIYAFQDDTHVLINPAYQNWLKEEITRLFDQNTFERKD